MSSVLKNEHVLLCYCKTHVQILDSLLRRMLLFNVDLKIKARVITIYGMISRFKFGRNFHKSKN